jgi:hypothetical protein
MPEIESAETPLIIANYRNPDDTDNNSCHSKCNTDCAIVNMAIICGCILFISLIVLMALLFSGIFN